jgi:hypothetical protein
VPLGHIVATVTLEEFVVFDYIVAVDITLVSLLTLSPVMWRKERLWNLMYFKEYTFEMLFILPTVSVGWKIFICYQKILVNEVWCR